MNDPKELSDDIAEQIEELSEKADELIHEDKLEAAFETVMEALRLIPEPRSEYVEATWLYAALGDIYFFADDYKQALSAFTDAVNCPEGLGNPFIHLRLGECEFEIGNMDKAADELMRAYMGDGNEIFESEDPKYLEFLKTRAKNIH